MIASQFAHQIEHRTSKMYRAFMQAVHRIIPDALANLLRKAPLTDEKVAFAWRAAVGPAIDRGTTVTLQDGILRVHAREAAWGREVERSQGLIRARLETLLGAGVVQRIDISHL